MSTHNITCFDARDPTSHFRLNDHLVEDINGLRAWEKTCCIVNADDENACPELLVFLPGVAASTLSKLARGFPRVQNVTTANHLECDTYLCWEAVGLEVRVHASRFCSRRVDDGNAEEFGVMFFNEYEAWHALHRMSSEEADDFEVDMQVAGICSGENYKPYREWSKEFLEEHAHLEDHDDRIIVPICLRRHRG